MAVKDVGFISCHGGSLSFLGVNGFQAIILIVDQLYNAEHNPGLYWAARGAGPGRLSFPVRLYPNN